MKSYYELHNHLCSVAEALGDSDLKEASKAFEEMLGFVSAAHPDRTSGGQNVGSHVRYKVHTRPGLVERVGRMTDAAMKSARGD